MLWLSKVLTYVVILSYCSEFVRVLCRVEIDLQTMDLEIVHPLKYLYVAPLYGKLRQTFTAEDDMSDLISYICL